MDIEKNKKIQLNHPLLAILSWIYFLSSSILYKTQDAYHHVKHITTVFNIKYKVTEQTHRQSNDTYNSICRQWRLTENHRQEYVSTFCKDKKCGLLNVMTVTIHLSALSPFNCIYIERVESSPFIRYLYIEVSKKCVHL